MALLVADSKKSVERLAEDLPGACARHAFGVLGVHDLRAKLREKGQRYDRACLVFEVCNPQQAKRALDAAPEISTALPCRVAVFETPDGRTRLATIRPTLLLDLFGARGLADVAREVETALERILAEAAGAA